MKPKLRLGYLVLGVFLIGSARVEASVWDWLEELNGPGPSKGSKNYMVNIICSDTTKGFNGTTRLFQIPDITKGDATCLFVDQRWFHAEEDDRFYPVDVMITEIGGSARLHRAVELGAGIGVIGFSSENPTTSRRFEGHRLTISFPRLVFKPLLALPIAPFKNNVGWGFLQMYFRETLIVGELNQDDFASKPGHVFSRTHQRVRSMGFIMDIPTVIHLIKTRGR